MTDDDRFTALEIKAARQEDLVETLNQLVYLQQKKLSELEAFCTALARNLKNGGPSDDAMAPDEKPPHY